VIAVRPPHLILGLEVLHANDAIFLFERALNLSVFDNVSVVFDYLIGLFRYFNIFTADIRCYNTSIASRLDLSPQVLGDSMTHFRVHAAHLLLPTAGLRLEIRIQKELNSSDSVLNVLILLETARVLVANWRIWERVCLQRLDPD
jgi:hypothetical protein